MKNLKNIIETSFKNLDKIKLTNVNDTLKNAVNEVINMLDNGNIRVSEQINNQWITNQWIKKAILIFFKINESFLMKDNIHHYFDKVPMKFTDYSTDDFKEKKIRVVPPASVRKGVYIDKNTILMPSYVNIGAYIGSGTMIDTWATVGSCAQIGKNVHLSGGVGIGGVLEPIQANPTIIEDNCFIGARSEIVEGVIVEKNSVISMGVYIGQSTKIYDRETGIIHYGKVPSGSVIVPGSLPSKNGSYNLYCAIIVKKVDEKTRKKTNINDLLRMI